MKTWKANLTLIVVLAGVVAAEAGDSLRQEISSALRKATAFYRTQAAIVEGGYDARYSEDLEEHDGEGAPRKSSVNVQPVGTPSVGFAYLEAFETTGEEYYLEAARETAMCLVRGQLRSGGWDSRIHFLPRFREDYAYRVEPKKPEQQNGSTLDDNTTQIAIQFLARIDKALGFRDEQIHEAAIYALDSLLKAQYPNGGWPQRYSELHLPELEDYSPNKAGFPDEWSETYPDADYTSYYTLNDMAMLDAIEVLFEAARLYGEPRYREAATRGADFLILAQLPAPQPGWAQQYDAEMHPAWARRFEPPAVNGRASQDAILTLLRAYRETANRKYLKPIPPAIQYFGRSLLPDGNLARFYEMKSNEQLGFTEDYRLTHGGAEGPSHYTFKTGSRLDGIEDEYERLRKTDPIELNREAAAVAESPPGLRRILGADTLTPTLQDRSLVEQLELEQSLKDEIEEVIADLDEKGRWIEAGQLGDSERVIRSATFIRNVHVLCAYLRASNHNEKAY